MADGTGDQKSHANEEIVEGLINDLNLNENATDNIQTSATQNKEHEEKPKEDADNCIPDDFEEETKEEKDPFLIDEIDEEELQTIEKSLTDEEKEQRHKEALSYKQSGNEKFKSEQFLESINEYTKALNVCPLAFTNDRSIFYCNRAASKMKLERNETAIEDCSMAITLNDKYVRAYLRRAKLNEMTDKLESCLEDYQKLLELDPGNAEARAAVVRLPPLIQERNEKLKTEMLGRLKDLGNMILKPFGLSTDNFQMDQDPKSGGYSVNFQQQRKS